MHAHRHQLATHREGFEAQESAPVLVVVVPEELELTAVLVQEMQSWVLPVVLVPELGRQIVFSFEEVKVVGLFLCSVHSVILMGRNWKTHLPIDSPLPMMNLGLQLILVFQNHFAPYCSMLDDPVRCRWSQTES